jgi:type I restriction enzyme R subunit
MVNPDGHEFLRKKWGPLVRRYWKYSEKLMVKHAGMVVCDSAPQARKLYEIFINKYNPDQAVIEPVAEFKAAADQDKEFKAYKLRTKKSITATLILHDSGTKEERKRAVTDFKEGRIDFLFVYNMLLTGFDAHRLKKLYIGRIIKDHNLLQTLTRVNRPYKNFRYGFVVDFADIRKEFDETNRAYFEELQQELGDEMKTYSNLFKTKEEIESEIEEIKEKLFAFDLKNAEVFSQQISEIADRKKILEIKKALENARNLYNLIRLSGNDELLDLIDFKKLSLLYNEASRHLDLLNLKESISQNGDNTNLLNIALENIIFKFQKISESELIIADQLREMLRKTREALAGNFDHKDPEFTSLYNELKRLFEKKNLDEISQQDMKQNIGSLRQILERVNELNRRNNNLRIKYNNDPKFARMHKRILEKGTISKKEISIHEALMDVKNSADTAVILNSGLLKADSYFGGMMMKMVIENFEKAKITLDPDSAKYINNLITKEYINEYHGVYQ